MACARNERLKDHRHCISCRSFTSDKSREYFCIRCGECNCSIQEVFCGSCDLYIKAYLAEREALEEKVRALETHIAASPGGALYLEAEGRWNETYHK